MNILVTGGTGFIGRVLCRVLLNNGHNLVVVSRNPQNVGVPIKAVKDLAELDASIVFDVVINLAGEAIANKRWSDKQKQEILQSRLNTTQTLIDYFEASSHKPKLLISGSAIGYYGIEHSNEDVTEDSNGDGSFSSALCKQWEAIAFQAKAMGVRVCVLRTGIVLGEKGGALQKMLPPFKLGLGGKMGSGDQWMPWIHIQDLVGLILYCIDHEDLSGAVNGTAPKPVTNKEFTKILGAVLNRPTFFQVPGLLIKLLMGQMGNELLLSGRKVTPVKALQSGYSFKFNKLEEALLDIL